MAAICEALPSVLDEHATKYQVPGYNRIEEMLEKAFIDVDLLDRLIGPVESVQAMTGT